MRWEPYIKNVLYAYPELLEQRNALRETATTPAYGGTGGRPSEPSDPVGNAALRELPEHDRRELEAVEKAIATTRAKKNGKTRLVIIQLVYWNRYRITLEEAARVVHYSYCHTRRMNQEFLEEVAKNIGIA